MVDDDDDGRPVRTLPHCHVGQVQRSRLTAAPDFQLSDGEGGRRRAGEEAVHCGLWIGLDEGSG